MQLSGRQWVNPTLSWHTSILASVFDRTIKVLSVYLTSILLSMRMCTYDNKIVNIIDLRLNIFTGGLLHFLFTVQWSDSRPQTSALHVYPPPNLHILPGRLESDWAVNTTVPQSLWVNLLHPQHWITTAGGVGWPSVEMLAWQRSNPRSTLEAAAVMSPGRGIMMLKGQMDEWAGSRIGFVTHHLPSTCHWKVTGEQLSPLMERWVFLQLLCCRKVSRTGKQIYESLCWSLGLPLYITFWSC